MSLQTTFQVAGAVVPVPVSPVPFSMPELASTSTSHLILALSEHFYTSLYFTLERAGAFNMTIPVSSRRGKKEGHNDSNCCAPPPPWGHVPEHPQSCTASPLVLLPQLMGCTLLPEHADHRHAGTEDYSGAWLCPAAMGRCPTALPTPQGSQAGNASPQVGSLYHEDLPITLSAALRSSPRVVLEEGRAALKLFLTVHIGAGSPDFQSFLSVSAVSEHCMAPCDIGLLHEQDVSSALQGQNTDSFVASQRSEPE